MTNKNVRGGILLEVLLTLGVMLIVFPLIQRNSRERAESLKNEQVIRDMTLLKSLVEEYLENSELDESLNFIEIPADGISGFLKNRGRREFKNANALGQSYSVKIRKIPAQDGKPAYDALVVSDGAEVPATRIRQIMKDSRGAGGYVEGDNIYGANWTLSKTPWDFGAPLTENALVFKTSRLHDGFRYISRTNPKYAAMRTDIFMNGNNIEQAGALAFVGDLQSVSVAVSDSGSVIFGRLSLTGGLTLAARLAGGIFVFAEGLSAEDAKIEDRETLAKIAVENLLDIAGSLTVSGEDSSAKTLSAETLENTIKGISEIIVGNSLLFSEVIGLGSAKEIKAARVNSKTPNGVAISVLEMIESETAKKYFIGSELAKQGGNTVIPGFYGQDVVVRNINKSLSGQLVGGIKITDDTPISVIIRALNYEYADIYKSVHGKLPPASDRYVKEWSLPAAARCLTENCAKSQQWDSGL